MPTANQILDELHAIREKMQARYAGQSVETIIRDLEARAAEFLENRTSAAPARGKAKAGDRRSRSGFNAGRRG